MNILIITSGFLPVPAVDGGAIEKLIEIYLKYNEFNRKDDIVVYSRYSEKIEKEKNNMEYLYSEFRYIGKQNDLKSKINRCCRFLINKIKGIYIGNIYISAILKDLKRRKELEKYDVVIVENIGMYCILLNKYFKNKIVLHMHNDYLNNTTKRAALIIQSCNQIWCVSKFIENRIAEICKNEIDKEKIRVIYNGIDLNKFNNQILKKQNLGDVYRIKKDDFVFLYTGRIMPEKGVKELIKSFIALNKKFNNTKLLIVGEKINNTSIINDYVDELKRIADKNTNIIFVGKVENNDLYKYYSISDAQIVPSLWNEAFGLTVIEGMASKIPLIVTNSGGIPELVDDNCALIVERSNIEEELLEKMEELIMNEEIRNNIVNSAFLKSKEFSKEKFCKNIEKNIEKMEN